MRTIPNCHRFVGDSRYKASATYSCLTLPLAVTLRRCDLAASRVRRPSAHSYVSYEEMAPPAGLEPATFGFGGSRCQCGLSAYLLVATSDAA